MFHFMRCYSTEVLLWQQYVNMVLFQEVIQKHNIPQLTYSDPNIRNANIIRGVIGFFSVSCLVYALQHTTLNLATTLRMTSPIIVGILSFFILKEKYDIWNAIGAFSGFLGVVLIIGFQTGGTFEGNLVALMSGIFQSLSQISLRSVGKSKCDEWESTKFFSLGSLIICFPMLFFVTLIREIWEFFIVFFIGIFSLLGQLSLSKGLQKVPAAKASVIGYLQVVYSYFVGILIFGEHTSFSSFIGCILIISNSVIIYLAQKNSQNNEKHVQKEILLQNK